MHGGVRYLAQGNIGLVREALHERGLLGRNALHVVWPLGFLVPAYNLLDQPFYGISLKMYDVLAGRLNLKSSRLLSQVADACRCPHPWRPRSTATGCAAACSITMASSTMRGWPRR